MTQRTDPADYLDDPAKAVAFAEPSAERRRQ